MKTTTVKFKRIRDTKRAVVFEETPPKGQAEVIGTLYVKQWFVGSAEVINVTVEVPDGTDE